MIKKNLGINRSGGRIPVPRPGGRIPTLRPAAQPGWYKRFRQLAARAGKTFTTK